MLIKISGSLLIALVNIWVAHGFSTDECDHESMSNHTRRSTKCLEVELLKSVDEILDDYIVQFSANDKIYDLAKGCKLVESLMNNIKDCIMNLATSCFDENGSEIIEELFENFSCNNFQKLLEQDHRHEENGQNAFLLIIGRSMNSLASILKWDRNCIQALLVNEFQKMMASLSGALSQVPEQILDIFRKNESIPQEIKYCVPFDQALETSMVENNCISGQEMGLIKHLFRAQYRIQMKTALQIKQKFGNFQRIYERLENTKITLGNTEYPEPQTTLQQLGPDFRSKMIEVFNRIIQDFETTECQDKINSGSKIQLSIFLFSLIFLCITFN